VEHADPDIPILKEAKAEYAKLQYENRSIVEIRRLHSSSCRLPFWAGSFEAQ